MSRRDLFIQIMMEAGGLPADSAFDYAGALFHDVDHNAGVGAPVPIMKQKNPSPCSDPGFPAPGRWLIGIWDKAKADIAEGQGQIH